MNPMKENNKKWGIEIKICWLLLSKFIFTLVSLFYSRILWCGGYLFPGFSRQSCAQAEAQNIGANPETKPTLLHLAAYHYTTKWQIISALKPDRSLPHIGVVVIILFSKHCITY